MKCILAGSSGFVGHELLEQCLKNPSVTSIVALSRRELPPHDKLQVVIVEDFSSYPDTAKEAVKDADACIWTIGLTPTKVPDEETARRVSIGYTTTAAKLFNENCRKPFRFVYCSGAGAEQDQTKPLWFMQDYRRIRGQVESEILKFANENAGFESYIVKPGLIFSRGVPLPSFVSNIATSIKVDNLAAKMLDLALKGGEKKVWENSEVNSGL
ncbi:uncharacterized protein N7469_007347 [Penicillium citrinum]|uniref:NAD(P)-binding domain-containing protein n=2 Tax=Penicillium TaxID=5073 RepID=A0A9W9NW85_PENCI|nr:uncharacterized protein N7469_007347 [Penicillium citrinum]KAJ5227341.1 hypothetical protein N7469_007347 [Penicillium citrinum]KAJ5568191.1 hypothetical protein N7450_010677 [Penicillium hetheringtonii]KAK5791588.1 hypothetical protein VI817_006897 [Penicillium citrinum]